MFWTGFFSEISIADKETETSKIFYLPSIAESPIKMSTVHEVLNQVKTKAEFQKNVDADLVLDQATYSKALETLMDPRNLDLKTFINLQMGSFHASCIFIAVIDERFGGAGLKDLCIEGTMIGSGSINSTMKGKKYNRGICILKILHEALQRLKLDAFEKWSQEQTSSQ